MSDPTFNPNVTQRVVKEVSLYRCAWAVAHRQLPTYYYYLVGISLALTSAPNLHGYISDKWRHWIVGVATVVVFLDKLRRSKPKTE